MGRFFNRLGKLLKADADEELPVETSEGPSAMDAAMQEAIKKRGRSGAGDAADQPRVTITPEKNRPVFGRRGA